MQLINKHSNKFLSIFILSFLFIVISTNFVLSEEVTNVSNNVTNMTGINNATYDLNQIVDTAVAMPTELDFIKTISNSVFLPSIAAYWITQFMIILIIGLLVINKDKDTYFMIFIVTQLISAVILFFIFVLPILPQAISNIAALI